MGKIGELDKNLSDCICKFTLYLVLLYDKTYKMANKKVSQDRLILLQKYLDEGYTQEKSAILAGENPKNMYYLVKRYNLKVKKRFGRVRINEEYFDNIDTETKAYILGFILADGYIQKSKNNYSLNINNSIDDISIIELIKNEISPEGNIFHSNKQTGANFRKPQVSMKICSTKLATTLMEKYGIKPAKTFIEDYKFNFELIPQDLIRHFIRGYFDGDGSVSAHKYKKVFFFNFSFVFNSLNLCEQFADIFESLFNLKRKIYKHKGKTANWVSMRFNYNKKRVEKIRKIYDYFYKDSKYYLTRKQLKFEEYFKYRANSPDKEWKVV